MLTIGAEFDDGALGGLVTGDAVVNDELDARAGRIDAVDAGALDEAGVVGLVGVAERPADAVDEAGEGQHLAVLGHILLLRMMNIDGDQYKSQVDQRTRF